VTEIDVRARQGAARCPYCRADLRAGEATWTCSSCQAEQHVECSKEAGGACVGCRAPAATATKSPGTLPTPRVRPPRGQPSRLHALANGYIVQAGLLVLAALTGRLMGGEPGLFVCAAAALSGAVATARSAASGPAPMFVAHVLSNAPLIVACLVGIDALDIYRSRPSPTMFGLCMALAAASAGISVVLRRF
jgi:hypothetical protein